MSVWDLGALARAAEAEIVGGALPMSVEAVGTDSRSLPPASLFVALRGERFDGHAFVDKAVAGGACAALVDRAGNAGLASLRVPRLVVRDTLRALGEIARYARAQQGQEVVAVTGSNGKTTTKELLAAALGPRGLVHKTTGNLNNLIGVPLTLLSSPDTAWAAVIEMGMNAPGEIARLAEIAAPKVGVITNVGPAHLEGLGTIENVGRAKGELFCGLGSHGIGIVNVDDPVILAVALPGLGSRRRLTFGTARGADVRVVSQALTQSGSRVTYEVLGQTLVAELPLVGPHNAMNAAAAIAAALALGVDAEAAASALRAVAVPGGRLRAVEIPARGIRLIDDTYNANPASMRAAFAALAQMATSRKVAVLADMLELGPTSKALHYEVGESAAALGLSPLFVLGANAVELARGAREGGASATHFAALDELLKALDETLTPGDWVLVKGSRGMHMERVVAHLSGRQG